MTDKDDLKISISEKDSAPEAEVQRVSKLIAEIKKITSGQAVGTNISEKLTTIDLEPLKEETPNLGTQETISYKDPALEFDALYLKIKRDLNYLVNSYLEQARPNTQRVEILSKFDEVINKIDPSETEISIPTILSTADTERVNDLFLLLEQEIASNTKKVRIDQIPLSATTILSRSDLEAVFEELSEKIIEEAVLPAEESIGYSEEIPYATPSHIFFAFLFDLLVMFGLSTYSVSFYTGDTLTFFELRPFLTGHLTQIIIAFFGLWFAIQAISLILVQATVGQSMTGVVVATDKNKSPSIPRLLARLSLHLFNFITLGLYSAVIVNFFLAKDKYGLYCPISKTRLTFSSFIKA